MGIDEILDKFDNAVYGKDVKKYYRMGIEQTYADGRAGSIDLVARKKIDESTKHATSKDIDNIINGLYTEEPTATSKESMDDKKKESEHETDKTNDIAKDEDIDAILKKIF